jgi:serine/threonine protein kinase
MAPELAFDPPLISAAADVFSFGVLAHQMLAGERPFDKPPVMTVAEHKPLPPELELDLRGIPTGLRATVRACLSLDHESRPGAARLAEVLAEFIRGRKSTRRSSPLPLVEMGDIRLRPTDPDVPIHRSHETSPPEPHAA